jgi:hypothetical protein
MKRHSLEQEQMEETEKGERIISVASVVSRSKFRVDGLP